MTSASSASRSRRRIRSIRARRRIALRNVSFTPSPSKPFMHLWSSCSLQVVAWSLDLCLFATSTMMTWMADGLCVSSLPSIPLRDAVRGAQTLPGAQVERSSFSRISFPMERAQTRIVWRDKYRLYRSLQACRCHNVDGECTLVSIA